MGGCLDAVILSCTRVSVLMLLNLAAHGRVLMLLTWQHIDLCIDSFKLGGTLVSVLMLFSAHGQTVLILLYLAALG